MPNISTTNYVIEGKKEELDALYQKMKELQGQNLGQLVKVLGNNPEEIWTKEVTASWKKVAMFFEFFFECVYIMHIGYLKFKRYGNNY